MSPEQCFERVKTEMGSDAIILESRPYLPILGRFGKVRHEVVATLDESHVAPRSVSAPAPAPSDGAAFGRGVYGYARGESRAEGERWTDKFGPPRAIEMAEARAAQLLGKRPPASAGFGTRSAAVRRPIETRNIDSRPIETVEARPVEARPIEVRGLPEEEAARSDRATLRYAQTGEERQSARGSKGEPVERELERERDARLQRLEAQLESLAANFTRLTEAAVARGKGGKPAAAPVAAAAAASPAQEPALTVVSYPNLRNRLIEAGIVEPLVRRMVDELKSGLTEEDAAEAIRTAIAGRVLIAGKPAPIAGRMSSIAFIGPSGVGKTTTLAKMAARMILVDRLRVAIVTLDTQRVAASRQIETFGEILRVPVKVAYDADELAEKYAELAADGYDFLLIDTPGRSPNDSIAIGDLSRTLGVLPSVTTYLHLPAQFSAANHDYVTGRFFTLATPTAVILTKCDESADATHFANLLTAQSKFGVPVAFTTFGPRVPDDIAEVNAHVVAEKLLARQ